LEVEDLAKLHSKFRRHDKDNSGTIDLGEFYKMVEEQRSVFGDAIFDLIDVDDSASVTFSELVSAILTYGMFAKEEVLKYCFFVFDKDKNGYIEEEELHALLDILHDHDVKGNMKTAMGKFDTNGDGKVDFEEFKQLHAEFPTLIYPAFRLQKNIQKNLLGDKWWYGKSVEMNDERDHIKRVPVDLRIEEEKRLLALKRRQMWRKWGNITGCCMYSCPMMCCEGNSYDELIKLDDALGAGLDTEAHKPEEGDRGPTEYERMLELYGRDFMNNAELLSKVNKYYNDMTALRHDTMAERRGGRKERTRVRREGRVKVGHF
jgi:Ca2+-binding EF-hand superfamily protein